MIAADIERIARRGTIAVSMLAAEVYRGRPMPRDPETTVRVVLCRMRHRGVPVHLHQGRVTIGACPAALPITPDQWVRRAACPLSDLELRVLKILREFRTIALTTREIAAEINYRSHPSKLCQIMRCIVAKGIPINRVGSGYRLARLVP